MYEKVGNILKMAKQSNTAAIGFICMDYVMARTVVYAAEATNTPAIIMLFPEHVTIQGTTGFAGYAAMVKALELAKQKGMKSIAVTAYQYSPVSRIADLLLLSTPPGEAGQLYVPHLPSQRNDGAGGAGQNSGKHHGKRKPDHYGIGDVPFGYKILMSEQITAPARYRVGAVWLCQWRARCLRFHPCQNGFPGGNPLISRRSP